ncbi:MAG: hypothetical protein ACI89X_004983, partial [Planctomycetota bacterium]
MNGPLSRLRAPLLLAVMAATLGFAGLVAAQDAAPPQQQKWKQLFNGKDLTGWTPKIVGYDLGENFGDTFRVVDGLLTVSYEHYDAFNGRFGHLFYKDEFASYRLRVEYR